MIDVSEIARLFRLLMEDEISAQELSMLEDWAKESPSNAELLRRVRDSDIVFNDVLQWLEFQRDDKWLDKLEKKTLQRIRDQRASELLNNRRTKRSYLKYVASIAIVLIGSYLYFQYNGRDDFSSYELADLSPGSNKATVTFSNGKSLELIGEKVGIILDEGGIYTDGSIGWQGDKESNELIVQTPKGGGYQVTLSEGTKIWLNSDSKLIYPSSFKNGNREIEIQGEAFLDVATIYENGEKVPFRVKVAEQSIEVLGTQFNVKGYEEEEAVETTLVEGSVRVQLENKALLLSPGEQSVALNGELEKSTVDMDQYLAWRDNYFMFFETELKEAMATLGRWYDFQVVYDKDIPETYLYGKISRKNSLTDVLKVLETSGLKYKIENIKGVNNLFLLK